jgi:hypothetical protein
VTHVNLAIAALAFLAARTDEPVYSGPQVSEKLAPFKVRGVYDAASATELDLVRSAGTRPLLLVFVHEATRPSIALTRVLMDYATSRSNDGLACGVVWLVNADDMTAAEQFLKRARHAMPARLSASRSTARKALVPTG